MPFVIWVYLAVFIVSMSYGFLMLNWNEVNDNNNNNNISNNNNNNNSNNNNDNNNNITYLIS